ncbi:hypothetical protein IV203_021214 [Nitzschia inconspicua]|uniref:Uncharacterized protein n=1 Tax=Nitzschia inconspicua TaxID=303405 RepID=A0A9K3KHN3_9STRA|nr:hypothetical protein IV203_021214 [Nitzschia inconspicua]
MCADGLPSRRKRHHTLLARIAGVFVLVLLNLNRGLNIDIESRVDHPSTQSVIDSPKNMTSLFSKPTSKEVGDFGTIQGICGPQPESNKQTSSFPYPGKHPKFLFGIPSTLSSMLEKERRQTFRETYLNFDRQIYDMAMKDHSGSSHTNISSLNNFPKQHNRVCSLQEWTCKYDQIHEECQIIYAFFVGDNATAPPYILDDSLRDFRSMLVSNNYNSTEELGLVRLNIRENQFDGKMTTWFQFAALVGEEFPEIDYAVKLDSDTLVFTPNFLENLEFRHWKLLNERNNLKTERIYGGVKYPKSYCGKDEKHHACPLPLVGDTYMSGELNFMSMDLARYIASPACPRENITIPHEDVSLSNYVYSYTNNQKLPAHVKNTTIDRIFVQQEHLLLTFNESAEMKSRKTGQSVNLQKQFRKFLWGHCNPRPFKNDALYAFFKDPKNVRKIWSDFITYYYDGVYGKRSSKAKSNQHRTRKASSQNIHKSRKGQLEPRDEKSAVVDNTTACAVLFFGLPRSFKRYVLPSIIRNVLVPNLQYNCDYYIHYNQIDREESSRSGYAGKLNADDVLLLEFAVRQLYNESNLNSTIGNPLTLPHVSFVSDTNATFWEAKGNLVEKYRTAKRNNGKFLYFPSEEPNYVYPTTMDNIVKQWHSIETVWNEMERSAKMLNKTYSRVAMLRSDVIFIDPIDIYLIQNKKKDILNQHITIPDWAGWPVNDRMVYGPYNAVKVWATERFERLDNYVRTDVISRAGYGMHPEKFLNRALLPHITKKLGYRLEKTKRFCFVRVRADGGIWIDDCNKGFPENNATRTFTRDLLPDDATCQRQAFKWWADQLYCNFTERDDVLWNLKEKPIMQSLSATSNTTYS